jgi:rhodanese-related sulfurtransferase
LDLLKQTNDIFLLDVHTPQQEHLDGTDAFIPFDQIVDSQNQLPNDKSTPILVYCRSGSMSLMASEDLFSLGYTNVYNLSGGIHAWEGAGFPINWNQVTK